MKRFKVYHIDEVKGFTKFDHSFEIEFEAKTLHGAKIKATKLSKPYFEWNITKVNNGMNESWINVPGAKRCAKMITGTGITIYLERIETEGTFNVPSNKKEATMKFEVVQLLSGYKECAPISIIEAVNLELAKLEALDIAFNKNIIKSKQGEWSVGNPEWNDGSYVYWANKSKGNLFVLREIKADNSTNNYVNTVPSKNDLKTEIFEYINNKGRAGLSELLHDIFPKTSWQKHHFVLLLEEMCNDTYSGINSKKIMVACVDSGGPRYQAFTFAFSPASVNHADYIDFESEPNKFDKPDGNETDPSQNDHEPIENYKDFTTAEIHDYVVNNDVKPTDDITHVSNPQPPFLLVSWVINRSPIETQPGLFGEDEPIKNDRGYEIICSSPMFFEVIKIQVDLNTKEDFAFEKKIDLDYLEELEAESIARLAIFMAQSQITESMIEKAMNEDDLLAPELKQDGFEIIEDKNDNYWVKKISLITGETLQTEGPYVIYQLAVKKALEMQVIEQKENKESDKAKANQDVIIEQARKDIPVGSIVKHKDLGEGLVIDHILSSINTICLKIEDFFNPWDISLVELVSKPKPHRSAFPKKISHLEVSEEMRAKHPQNFKIGEDIIAKNSGEIGKVIGYTPDTGLSNNVYLGELAIVEINSTQITFKQKEIDFASPEDIEAWEKSKKNEKAKKDQGKDVFDSIRRKDGAYLGSIKECADKVLKIKREDPKKSWTKVYIEARLLRQDGYKVRRSDYFQNQLTELEQNWILKPAK